MAAMQASPTVLTISEQLWQEAYLKLTQASPKIVEEFEKKWLTPGQPGNIKDIAAALARKLRERDSKPFIVKIRRFEMSLREQGENIVKFVLWSSDLVSQMASLEPHAAIAWAGISLLLPVSVLVL